MKKLLLGHNNDTEIWQEQFSANSFPRLKVLDVCGYGIILVAIPSFMLQGLHNVEELHVGDSSLVKEVFQLEGLEEEHQVKPLRWLRILELWHLPGLRHLWKENNKPDPDLHSLDNLINLVSSSVVSFQNLATLDVRFCGSLRGLISPSIAKNIVELQTLIARGSCETPENPDFLRKDKMVISVKIRNFSRSRMTKRTSPLESSRKIWLPRRISLNSETVEISRFSRHVEDCRTLGTL